MGFTDLSPNLRFVNFLSKLSGSFNVLEILNEYSNSFNMFAEFLVNAKSFIIKLILLFLGNLSEFLAVVVIKSVNVIHNSCLVCFDGSKDQKVLKILVVSEV